MPAEAPPYEIIGNACGLGGLQPLLPYRTATTSYPAPYKAWTITSRTADSSSTIRDAGRREGVHVLMGRLTDSGEVPG